MLLRMGSVVALVVVAAGCPRGGGGLGPDGGPVDGGAGNGGTVDVGCAADEDCGAGEICDLTATPHPACVAGLDCSQNAGICDFCGDASAQCGFGTAPAYCSSSAGVCRRQRGA